MLKRSFRLPRELFKDLGKNLGFFHTQHFMMKTTPSPAGPRIGVSVSKKVAKEAHIRNRTRRRVYDAVTPLIPSMSQELFLIIAKSGAPSLKGEVLKQELAELFKKS